ncbi:hypothetical protein ACFLQU_01945 [Verrucomicrobiota bacterium]
MSDAVHLPAQAHDERRNGVILIIVLCMFGVMMILAAAFSVVVRTERVSSGNYVDGVRVRHLLLAGINRAIWDIERSMSMAQSTNVYPQWEVLVATNDPWGAPLGSNEVPDGTKLAWGEAMRYIPVSLHAKVAETNAVWQDMELKDPTGESKRVTHVRVAYMIVNMSGLLDAGFAGGQPRMIGAGPEEVTLDDLPEIVSASNFVALREDDFRYETLPELTDMQALPNDQGGFYPDADANSFCVYSYYPVGRLAGDAVETEYASVAGSASDIMANQLAIKNAFLRSGLSNSLDAMLAVVNLGDYIDDDRLPGNMGGPYNQNVGTYNPFVDAFPMFNEVYCESIIQIATNEALNGINYSAAYRFMFECMYPFISPTNSNDHTFRCKLTFTNDFWSQWHFEPNNGNPVYTPYLDLDMGQNTYWTYTMPMMGFAGRFASGVPTKDLVVKVRVDTTIRDADSNVVDVVRTDMPLMLRFTNTVVITTNKPQVLFQKKLSRECVDPRMNFNGTLYWMQNTNDNTIGTLNKAAQDLWATNRLADGDHWMYVKQDELDSVGELGSIFYGRPWETIRLYNRGSWTNKEKNTFHTVLDHFTISENPQVARKGMINMNSDETNVLRAVFKDMPIREYFTNGAGEVISKFGNVDMVVKSLSKIEESATSNLLPNCEFTNLSDIGWVDWRDVWNSHQGSVGPEAPFCEIDREAVIRNSAGMFGIRQNLFVIIVGAGHYRTGAGMVADSGDWVGQQRAIAVVWRDPYPAPGSTPGNRRHRWFIRMFKQLGNES